MDRQLARRQAGQGDGQLAGQGEALRVEARAFAAAEVAPLAAACDEANAFPAGLWRKLGEAGLLGVTIPPAYGGRGLGFLPHLLAIEEISRASPAIGLSYCAHSNICLHNLFLHGTEAQRRRYLPGLCSGEAVGALAMTEPEAGSDIVGSMTSQAVWGDGAWIANGAKRWITNGPEADVLIVYLRTAPKEEGTRSITAFLLEKGMPGFRQGPPLDKLGMRGSTTGELFFEDCRIPSENVLGAVNGGVRILMAGLDTERVLLSGGPLGLMGAVLDLILPRVRERRQFGQPVGTFELMQGKLADLYMGYAAAQAFCYRVAAAFDAGRPSRRDAASCLLFASEAAVRAALEAIQCFGGEGYLRTAPVSRLLRDAKVFDLGGGTNEIRRVVIGRELFAHGIDLPGADPLGAAGSGAGAPGPTGPRPGHG
jgi:isovaleryl-CoA dehydrogenase